MSPFGSGIGVGAFGLVSTRRELAGVRLSLPKVFGSGLPTQIYYREERKDVEGFLDHTETRTLTLQQLRPLSPRTRLQWSHAFGERRGSWWAPGAGSSPARWTGAASTCRSSTTAGQLHEPAERPLLERERERLRGRIGLGRGLRPALRADLRVPPTRPRGLGAGGAPRDHPRRGQAARPRRPLRGRRALHRPRLPRRRPRPPGSARSALGGRAVLVLNEELRFPIRGGLQGGTFFDWGNVFARPSDLRLSELRASAGAGLRYVLPFAVLRLDWARLLDPRPAERKSRFVLSLGHAF